MAIEDVALAFGPPRQEMEEKKSFSPDVLSLYNKIEGSRYDGKDKAVNPKTLPDKKPELNPMDIALLGNQVIDEKMGDVAPEIKKAAFLKAKDIQSGEASPEVKTAIKQFSQAPDNPEAVIGGRRASGADDSDTAAALLGIVFMGLAGAAVGGKKGALAGIAGSGQYVVDEMKADKEAEREESKYRARQDAELEQAKALSDYKNRPEAVQAQLDARAQERRQDKRIDREAKALENADEAKPLQAQMGDILGQAERIYGDSNYFDKKLSETFDQNSPEALLKDRIVLLAMDMTKLKQGSRPSDFDVQKILEAVRGNQLTGPEGALSRLRQLKKDMDMFVRIQEETANQGELSPETAKAKAEYESRQRGLADPDVSAALRARSRGLSRAQVEQLMKDKGRSVSPGLEKALGLVYGNG